MQLQKATYVSAQHTKMGDSWGNSQNTWLFNLQQHCSTSCITYSSYRNQGVKVYTHAAETNFEKGALDRNQLQLSWILAVVYMQTIICQCIQQLRGLLISVCLMQLHTHLVLNLVMNVSSLIHMQIIGHTQKLQCWYSFCYCFVFDPEVVPWREKTTV